jgi:hypothetical protein
MKVLILQKIKELSVFWVMEAYSTGAAVIRKV